MMYQIFVLPKTGCVLQDNENSISFCKEKYFFTLLAAIHITCLVY